MTIKLSYVAWGVFFSLALTNTLIGCTSGSGGPAGVDAAATAQPPTEAELVARGHYLVEICGCHDCHTPKVFTPLGTLLDSSRILSGHPEDAKLPPVDTRSYVIGYWMTFSPDITASVGSWGENFAANLTPDTATGIGAWTVRDFVQTIRTGKHLGQKGGRQLQPPMPWMKFAKMTDEDLESVYTYLRTIPPIHNRVPECIPPPPGVASK